MHLLCVLLVACSFVACDDENPVLTLADVMAVAPDAQLISCDEFLSNVTTLSQNGVFVVRGCASLDLAHTSVSERNVSVIFNVTDMVSSARDPTGDAYQARGCSVHLGMRNVTVNRRADIIVTGSNFGSECSVVLNISDSAFVESRFVALGVKLESGDRNEARVEVSDTRATLRDASAARATSIFLWRLIRRMGASTITYGYSPVSFMGPLAFRGPNTVVALRRVTFECRITSVVPTISLPTSASALLMSLDYTLEISHNATYLVADSNFTASSGSVSQLYPAAVATGRSNLRVTDGATLAFVRISARASSDIPFGLSSMRGGAITIMMADYEGTQTAKAISIARGSHVLIVNSTLSATLSTSGLMGALIIIATKGNISVAHDSSFGVLDTTMTAESTFTGIGQSRAVGIAVTYESGSFSVSNKSRMIVAGGSITATGSSALASGVGFLGKDGRFRIVDESSMTFDNLTVSARCNVGFGAGGILIDHRSATVAIMDYSSLAVLRTNISVFSNSPVKAPEVGAIALYHNSDSGTLAISRFSTFTVSQLLLTVIATLRPEYALGIVFGSRNASLTVSAVSSILIQRSSIQVNATLCEPNMFVSAVAFQPDGGGSMSVGNGSTVAVVQVRVEMGSNNATNTLLYTNLTDRGSLTIANGSTVSLISVMTTQTVANVFHARLPYVVYMRSDNTSQVNMAGSNPSMPGVSSWFGGLLIDKLSAALFQNDLSTRATTTLIFTRSETQSPLNIVDPPSGLPTPALRVHCSVVNGAPITLTTPGLFNGTASLVNTTTTTVLSTSGRTCARSTASASTFVTTPLVPRVNLSTTAGGCEIANSVQLACGLGAAGAGYPDAFEAHTTTTEQDGQCECRCPFRPSVLPTDGMPVELTGECVVQSDALELDDVSAPLDQALSSVARSFVTTSWSLSASASVRPTTSQTHTSTPSTASVSLQTRSSSVGSVTLSASSTNAITPPPTRTTTVSSSRGTASGSATKSGRTATLSSQYLTTTVQQFTPTPTLTRTASRPPVGSLSMTFTATTTSSVTSSASRHAATRSVSSTVSVSLRNTISVTATVSSVPSATRHAVSPTRLKSESASLTRTVSITRLATPTVQIPPPPTPPPTIESIPEDVVESSEAVVGTTAAASSALASPGAAMQASRALAVVALASCAFRHDQEIAFPVSLWPGFVVGDATRGGYYRGAVVANAVTTFGFVGLAGVLGGVMRFGLGHAMGRVLGALRFPGALVFMLGFALEGLVSNSISTLRHADATDGDVALIGFVGLCTLAYLLLAHRLARRMSRKMCDYEHVPLTVYSTSTFTHLCGWSVKDEDLSKLEEEEDALMGARSITGARLRWKQFIIGEMLWVPKRRRRDMMVAPKGGGDTADKKSQGDRSQFVLKQGDVFTSAEALRATGFFFKKYRPHARTFYVTDAFFAIVVAGLRGVRPETHQGCIIVMALTFALALLFLIIAAFVRPYTTNVGNLLVIGTSALTAAGAGIAIAGIALENSSIVVTGQSLAVFAGYSGFAGTAFAMYRRAALWQHERRMNRRSKREFQEDAVAAETSDRPETLAEPLLHVAEEGEADGSTGSSGDNVRRGGDNERNGIDLDSFLGPRGSPSAMLRHGASRRYIDEDAIVDNDEDLAAVDPVVGAMLVTAEDEPSRDYVRRTGRTPHGRQFLREKEATLRSHYSRAPPQPEAARRYYDKARASTAWTRARAGDESTDDDQHEEMAAAPSGRQAAPLSSRSSLPRFS